MSSAEQVNVTQGQGTEASKPLTIAVIIPTKERREDLLESVASMVAQNRRPNQLIIIDQSKESCEADLHPMVESCKDMEMKYLWVPEVSGLAAARTRGVNEAVCDIVFFVDDDITMEPDCIQNLLNRYAEHPEYAGICAVDVEGARVPWWLVIARRAYMQGPFKDERSMMNKRFFLFDEPRQVRLVSGGYMSYKRWLFDQYHFEDRLWVHRWNGSIDFSYRVSQDYPIVIDPKVHVHHRRPYGTYSSEEFVRVRVSGTFFFFVRNVKKDLVGWASFSLVLFAIFLISIRRGLQARALGHTLATFFHEVRQGFRFIKSPFPASY